VATKDVGADGTVVGTLYDDDDADAALVRNPVYAVTANVYESPTVRPVIVHETVPLTQV